MDYKRAIGLGVLAYLVSLLLGVVIAVIFGVDLSSAEIMSTTMWIISIFVQIIVALVFAYWYFAAKAIKHYGWKEGLHLGAIFVIISIVVDFLFILPWIFTSGLPTDILVYYSHPLFWVSVVLFLVCTGLVGSWFEYQNLSLKK